jgi:hypothetical protein
MTQGFQIVKHGVTIALEKHMVYALYGLTPEEIAIVEGKIDESHDDHRIQDIL